MKKLFGIARRGWKSPLALMALCAAIPAAPAGAEIIVNGFTASHLHGYEGGDRVALSWTSGEDHLSYRELWTPLSGSVDLPGTHTQTRAQDRLVQDPVTGVITGQLVTSTYWQTGEPKGCSAYVSAGAYLSMNVTITTPGEYGLLWLVAGPGWPNDRAFLPSNGHSEVAWEVLNSSLTATYLSLDLYPPAAPLAGGHMSVFLEPGNYVVRSTNVLWPVPILPGPGERHVDQTVWFQFAAPTPGPLALVGLAVGVLGARRRR